MLLDGRGRIAFVNRRTEQLFGWEERIAADQSAPWPKQGPASYFPSIEQKYGRSIAEWQKTIAGRGLEKHMEIVGYLKSEHGMGHGHANALVGWTHAGNAAAPCALP